MKNIKKFENYQKSNNTNNDTKNFSVDNELMNFFHSLADEWDLDENWIDDMYLTEESKKFAEFIYSKL